MISISMNNRKLLLCLIDLKELIVRLSCSLLWYKYSLYLYVAKSRVGFRSSLSSNEGKLSVIVKMLSIQFILLNWGKGKFLTIVSE